MRQYPVSVSLWPYLLVIAYRLGRTRIYIFCDYDENFHKTYEVRFPGIVERVFQRSYGDMQ